MPLYVHVIVGVTVLMGDSAARGAVPDIVTDPGNSRWLCLGETIVANGLFLTRSTSEGACNKTTRAGRACWEVVPAPRDKGGAGGRYMYFHVGPWAQWSAWIGERDVELTFEYFDDTGTVPFGYDSSDETVRRVAQHPGAWRESPDLPKGLRLTGTGQWKRKTIHLPQVLFRKRCNGHDFRFGPVPGKSRFALAALVLRRVPRRAKPNTAPKGQVRVPLTFTQCTGLAPKGDRLRLPGRHVQEPGKPIVLEGEDAATLATTDHKNVGLDATASGGRYVHFASSATFVFEVATPGKYRAWQRARFPHRGHWNHSESMDKAPVNNVSDNRAGPYRKWLWVKGPIYELTRGQHTYIFHNYHAGAQLDQIVFTRNVDAQPSAPLPSSANRGPTVARAEAAEVRPLDVKQWLALRGDMLGHVGIEVSADGGKTWAALPAGGDLRGIGARGAGQDALRFRFELKVEPSGARPLVQNLVLAYKPGPGNTIRLANRVASLDFTAVGPSRLRHLRTGHDLNSEGAQAPMFVLWVKKPGWDSIRPVSAAGASLVSHRLHKDKDRPSLELIYRTADRIEAKVTVGMEPDGVTRWRLSVRNGSPLEVAEIEFPILAGVRMGKDHADDRLVLPRFWGQLWRNPVEVNVRTSWSVCMRWMDLFDGQDGLYVATHDNQFHDTGLTATPDSARTLKMMLTKRLLIRPKATWQSDDYVVGFHTGDWHWGADRYRQWAQKALRRCDSHEWVRWCDGWQTQSSNDFPGDGFELIARDAHRIRQFGMNFIGANRQMLDGADSGYCGMFPFPSPVWGTTREFAQHLETVRLLGMHYVPYMNWRLWSPGYGHYPRMVSFPKVRLPKTIHIPDDAWYRQVALYSYEGQFHNCVEDRLAQAGVCVGSKAWQERLRYWTERYVHDYKADGMYYDQYQIVNHCANLKHGHDGYGFWLRACADHLARIKAEMRKVDPYYVSTGECAIDVTGQSVDMHMTSGVVNRLDIYRYAIPDQILLDGGWNGGTAERFGGHARYRFVWQVGARFEQLRGPGDWPGKVLALRRQVKSLLYRSRFMDTVGVCVTDGRGKPARVPPLGDPKAAGVELAPVGGVQARWFLFDQGRQRAALLNIINEPANASHRVTIDTSPFGPVRAAWAWTLEGQFLRVSGQEVKGRYTFPVPASELSSVLLVSRLGPVVRWTLKPVPTTRGEAIRLNVAVRNVTVEPLTGTVATRLPKGWPATRSPFGPVAPGQEVVVAIPIDVPLKTPNGRYDVRAEVITPFETFTTYSLACVTDPLMVEFRGHPGTYRVDVRNLTGRAVNGNVAVKAPAPVSARALSATFGVGPFGTASTPVTVRDHSRLVEIAEMEVAVEAQGTRYERVRALIPTVPNGDFEIDSAGDGLPDWWFARGLRDRWLGYYRIHLDPKDPAHGRICLRVEPSVNPKGFVRAYNVHGAIKPDTTYRIGVSIKRQEPRDKVWARFGGLGYRTLGQRSQAGGKWERFEAVVRSSSRARACCVSLYNQSRHTAWFDHVVVEETDNP